MKKNLIVIFDFDGLLIDSYELMRTTFESFGLDVGDKGRFKNRRKFLKYFGGGKELLRNLSTIALPKKKRLREALTESYVHNGTVYKPFVPFINQCIAAPNVHCGVVSRNYALRPGKTIRAVLKNSSIDEDALDFVVPISIGTKKHDVLEAMCSKRYELNLFAGDEVGDYRAAVETGYTALMASYGFDTRKRLIELAEVPKERIFNSPEKLVREFERRTRAHLS